MIRKSGLSLGETIAYSLHLVTKVWLGFKWFVFIVLCYSQSKGRQGSYRALGNGDGDASCTSLFTVNEMQCEGAWAERKVIDSTKNYWKCMTGYYSITIFNHCNTWNVRTESLLFNAYKFLIISGLSYGSGLYSESMNRYLGLCNTRWALLISDSSLSTSWILHNLAAESVVHGPTTSATPGSLLEI